METAFTYRKERDFVGAASRCVGVGKCRNRSGKVMCPSYRGTLEEKYSTRGRARLLFEMLTGDPLSDLEQISQLSDRHPVHLAEVLRMAPQAGRAAGHNGVDSTESDLKSLLIEDALDSKLADRATRVWRDM
ncbi:MAG: hypothetical protein IPK66_15855 [Rhodospirillales bacterium]|nr:hypothetical protein [Rhodospirillales bacterium]